MDDDDDDTTMVKMMLMYDLINKGIIQAMPGIAHCWYDRLIRATVGHLLATAGGMLHSANETALLLSKRGREIEHGCKLLEQSRKLNPVTIATATATNAAADSSAESSAATTDVDMEMLVPAKM